MSATIQKTYCLGNNSNDAPMFDFEDISIFIKNVTKYAIGLNSPDINNVLHHFLDANYINNKG
jgi:predicted mannosyl-3-phosphoglycerate phosphatase (HAD superfamily)